MIPKKHLYTLAIFPFSEALSQCHVIEVLKLTLVPCQNLAALLRESKLGGAISSYFLGNRYASPYSHTSKLASPKSFLATLWGNRIFFCTFAFSSRLLSLGLRRRLGLRRSLLFWVCSCLCFGSRRLWSGRGLHGLHH